MSQNVVSYFDFEVPSAASCVSMDFVQTEPKFAAKRRRRRRKSRWSRRKSGWKRKSTICSSSRITVQNYVYRKYTV